MFEFPQWHELISGTVVVETTCIALVTVLGVLFPSVPRYRTNAELTVPTAFLHSYVITGPSSVYGIGSGPGRTLSGAAERRHPGLRRHASQVFTVKTIGPMDPDGSVLNFSFAATLIRVRNRSKDLRRSITVDGAGRPDTASNASSETAKLIRRMPSRISKRIKFPSREETTLDVPLISIPS